MINGSAHQFIVKLRCTHVVHALAARPLTARPRDEGDTMKTSGGAGAGEDNKTNGKRTHKTMV